MEPSPRDDVNAEATPHGWRVFAHDPAVLIRTYSFGPGTSNALAVRGQAGVLVLSPPYRATQGLVDDLARFGTVCALVASNAFHHLGIREWKARFPNAAVFAPAQSIARVQRQTGVEDIRPIAAAAPLAGPRIELVDMPHYRTGEVLVRLDTERGRVWYVTDLIMNMPEVPRHPIFGPLFKLTGSAPGLKYNNVGPLFMVKDRKALKGWLAGEYSKAPPRWLIATHGDVADLASDPEGARRLFGALTQ
jgi:hypothetical protein